MQEFQIAHADIQLKGIRDRGTVAAFRHALERSWAAGAEVTRYARTWKLSRITRLGPSLSAGRIGFVRANEHPTLSWDPSTQDFVGGQASGGAVVPFLIDEDARIVSFQLIPGKIRPNTVASNLRALLEFPQFVRWEVTVIAQPSELRAWSQTVRSITKVSVHLERPNPNWLGREKLADLIEGLRASTVSITATAYDHEGIDPESDWFQQAMDHVSQNYGRAKVTGHSKTTDEPSTFVHDGVMAEVPLVDKFFSLSDETTITHEHLRRVQLRLFELHPSLSQTK